MSDDERLPDPEEPPPETTTEEPDEPESDPEAIPESAEEPESKSEFEEREVAPDEFRMSREFLEQMLGLRLAGQIFTGITANGSSMYGNGNNQFNLALTKRPILTPPAAVGIVAHCYAPTGVEEALHRLLADRTTVCLTGAPETGRFTTACRVLLRRFPAGAITEIHIPPDQSVADAVHEESELPARQGYVMHIRDEDPAVITRLLDGRVRKAGSKLVLIRDRAGRTGACVDGEIEHVAPAPRDVFREHARLADPGRADLPEYLHVIGAGDHLPDRPAEVVPLVPQVLSLPVGAVDAFLSGHNTTKVRAEARGYLEVTGDESPAGRRRLRQHRRAFRIAYAASVGQPIGQVFTATGLLLSELDAESGWAELGRTALEHSTRALLGREPGRAARLDDALVAAIFDVAWHEFDHTRPALVAWLNQLVDRREFVSTAVLAVTKLALADFDEVFASVINEWAGSRRVHRRRAAAQLVVILSSVPALRERVLRAVHRWVSVATKARHDTAASAYASGLHQGDPRWNLADLRVIAGDRTQLRSWTIAEAVRQLLRAGHAGLVVGALAEWIRDDVEPRLVTRHAARALVRMATVPAGDRWNQAPALLAGLADRTVLPHDLGPLWYAALLGESTKRRAWPALFGWLQYAETDVAARKPVADLLNEMALKAPILRRRLRFNLDRPDAPDWITTLIEEWKQ